MRPAGSSSVLHNATIRLLMCNIEKLELEPTYQEASSEKSNNRIIKYDSRSSSTALVSRIEV